MDHFKRKLDVSDQGDDLPNSKHVHFADDQRTPHGDLTLLQHKQSPDSDQDAKTDLIPAVKAPTLANRQVLDNNHQEPPPVPTEEQQVEGEEEAEDVFPKIPEATLHAIQLLSRHEEAMQAELTELSNLGVAAIEAIKASFVHDVSVLKDAVTTHCETSKHKWATAGVQALQLQEQLTSMRCLIEGFSNSISN